MSDLSQTLANLDKQRDADLSYKLQKLTPLLEQDFMRRQQLKLEAQKIDYERQGAEAQLKDYGITPDWSVVPNIPGAYDAHAKTLMQQAGLGATAAAEGITLPTEGNFFDKTASVNKQIEDKKATDNPARQSDKLTDAQKLDTKAKSQLTTEYYNIWLNAIKDPNTDPELALNDIKEKKGESDFIKHAKITKQINDDGTIKPTPKMKALNLDPNYGRSTLYYNQNEQYYQMPIHYDATDEWVYDDNGSKVNLDFGWLKAPPTGTAASDILTGRIISDKMIVSGQKSAPTKKAGKNNKQFDSLYD